MEKFLFGRSVRNPFTLRQKYITYRWIFMLVVGMLIAVFASGFSGAARAHAEKPRHGGQIVEVGDLHVELLVKDAKVTVYVSDHGKPLSVSGSSGRLISVGKSGRQDFALLPAADGSALTADVAEITQPGAKLVVTVTVPGRKPLQARFLLPSRE